MQAPNLSKLKGTLDAIGRVRTQLVPEKKGPEIPENILFTIAQSLEVTQARIDSEAFPPAVALHGWAKRQEAYTTLSALAAYLSLVEPHSPTP